jgi:hypothetical protein
MLLSFYDLKSRHTFDREVLYLFPLRLGLINTSDHKFPFFPMAHQPLVNQALLTIEALRSHSVWLLWTSDRPVAETSTWQHTALTRDRYSCHRRDFFPLSRFFWSIFYLQLLPSFFMSRYVPYYRPYNKHNTNIHAPGGIRTQNPSNRTAADLRLRPRGRCNRNNFPYG